MTQKITVIRGDGIGPEIMDATLFVLDQLGAGLEYEFADAGVVALEKHGDLMPKETLDSIARNAVALKSPLTTRKKPRGAPGPRPNRCRRTRAAGRVGSSRSAGLRGNAPVARPL